MAGIINSIKEKVQDYPRSFMNSWRQSSVVKTGVLAASAVLSKSVSGWSDSIPTGGIEFALQRLANKVLPSIPSDVSKTVSHLAANTLGFGLAVQSQEKQVQNNPAPQLTKATYWKRFAKTLAYIGTTFVSPVIPIGFSVAKKIEPANGGQLEEVVENRVLNALRPFGRFCRNHATALTVAAAGITAASASSVVYSCGTEAVAATLQTRAAEAVLSTLFSAAIGIWASPRSISQEPEFMAYAASSLAAIGLSYARPLAITAAAVFTAKLGNVIYNYCAAPDAPQPEELAAAQQNLAPANNHLPLVPGAAILGLFAAQQQHAAAQANNHPLANPMGVLPGLFEVGSGIDYDLDSDGPSDVDEEENLLAELDEEEDEIEGEIPPMPPLEAVPAAVAHGIGAAEMDGVI